MNALFEYSDKLNAPYECFVFDASVEQFPIQPHWHYFMEIIYMLEGTALMNCDDQSFVVEEGDLVLFLPHQIHSIYAVANMTLKYCVLKFDVGQLSSSVDDFTPKTAIHFPPMLRAAKGDPAAKLFFRREELEGFPAKELFERGCLEMQRQEYGYWLIMQSYVNMLLTFVLRRWRNQGFETYKAIMRAPKEDNIYFITEYIDAHIQDTLKVEELAKLCNMSYSYFAKNFNEMYGQSCKKYVEFVRLCKAEKLLLFTNWDMNYISQETGFSDCSHFIRCFKSQYGMTPKKYRDSKGGR